jgi:Na+/H+ antiporter NhaA
MFALANAGVMLSPEILADAAGSTLTWGVVVGLAIGKLLGIFGSSALLRRSGLGEFGAGLTLDRILGGAALCGIGFTISLFIVDLAIDAELAQNQARVGVLAASVIAFALATIIFRISDAVRPDTDADQTLGRAEPHGIQQRGPAGVPGLQGGDERVATNEYGQPGINWALPFPRP